MQINYLNLYTQNFSAQVEFYSKVLGLEVEDSNSEYTEFKIGKSILRFTERETSTPYHFAINIPCNKEKEALAWLKERVEVIKNDNNEIQDFDFWNAKAIYFYDKDHNIVEFIARNNLENGSNEEFTSNSLLEISEIGMPVDDIQSTYNVLYRLCEIEVFDGGFDEFCAIGDENGLFICINRNERDWFPTGDKAHSSNFEIAFIENEKEYSAFFKEGNILLNN